jgi:hypothetical protein
MPYATNALGSQCSGSSFISITVQSYPMFQLLVQLLICDLTIHFACKIATFVTL